MSLREEHYEIFPEDRPDGINHSDPFSKPFIDNYCSENEAKVYLTKEDITELGFLRSNPERAIYKHKDKPNLYLQQDIIKDYSVKDLAVELIQVFIQLYSPETGGTATALLYSSTKPNKEDIQQVINNYAA